MAAATQWLVLLTTMSRMACATSLIVLKTGRVPTRTAGAAILRRVLRPFQRLEHRAVLLGGFLAFLKIVSLSSSTKPGIGHTRTKAKPNWSRNFKWGLLRSFRAGCPERSQWHYTSVVSHRNEREDDCPGVDRFFGKSWPSHGFSLLPCRCRSFSTGAFTAVPLKLAANSSAAGIRAAKVRFRKPEGHPVPPRRDRNRVHKIPVPFSLEEVWFHSSRDGVSARHFAPAAKVAVRMPQFLSCRDAGRVAGNNTYGVHPAGDTRNNPIHSKDPLSLVGREMQIGSLIGCSR